MVKYLFALLYIWYIQACDGLGYHHFNGASMSYTVKETNISDQHEIHIRLITGWVLGKGPCGPSCTEADIGRDTKPLRTWINGLHSDSYFGKWFEEFTTSSFNHKDNEITDVVTSNMTEKIIGVNTAAQWEQALMEARFLLNVTKSEVDIKYTGQSWRNRTDQGNRTSPEGEKWQVQIKVKLGVRNDTNKPNQSPAAIVKPYYRMKLNEVSEIHIAAADPDGDYVKCKQSMFIEALSLSASPLKGLTVLDSCKVILNTSTSLGYKDDYWGGIAVTIKDYNKRVIYIGNKKELSGDFSIGGTPVQFLVHVLEHLVTPKFVQPTLEGNHEFIVYMGSVWSTTLYAEASENTTIEDFVSRGLQNEKIVMSVIKDDDSNRDRVRQVDISWKPEVNDKGRHIICTQVIDNTGVDSPEDKCFIVDVRDMFHTQLSPVGNQDPYFTSLPSMSEAVVCKVDMTCTIPLYIHSTNPVREVTVTKSELDRTYFQKISVSPNDTSLYQTGFYLRHSQYGTQKICVVAMDINGKPSEEACFMVEIEPPDPCFFNPCENSGECIRNMNDTTDYECINCPTGFYGKNCERKVKEYCDSNPCEHGRCSSRTKKCYCLSSGFSGPKCSINIDNCEPDPCNNHGVCIDRINSYTCSCFSRYQDYNCSHDRCPVGRPADAVTCPGDISGCAANTCLHGICIGNGKCVCQLGYNGDTHCSTPRGDIHYAHSQVTILPPTLEAKSNIICYTDEPCAIDIFFTGPLISIKPTVSVNKITMTLQNNVTISSVTDWNEISGISGMLTATVTVTATSTMKGYICVLVQDILSKVDRCFSLKMISNPANMKGSLEYKQQNNSIKFLPPTIPGESTIVCKQHTTCYLLLYTSVNNTSGMCDKPVSTDTGVTVLQVESKSGACQTQVSITKDTTGNHRVCFQSTLISIAGQKRCFSLQVFDGDPCDTSRCQNNAECFYTEDIFGNTTCECETKYEGLYCELGPCQSAENDCLNGYCEIKNHTRTCMCPIGFHGDRCEKSFPAAITDLDHTGAQFTDIALPKLVTCIRNKLCVIPVVASGRFPSTQIPNVRSGYVSTHIHIDDLQIHDMKNGSYMVKIGLIGRRVGVHDACILSMNKTGVNMDELCLKVNVVDVTANLYSDKDTPHFLPPSVPPDSELVCTIDQPCHLLFRATPGDQYKSEECVELNVSPPGLAKYHIYSSCETCSSGSADTCLFDMVVYLKTDTDVCVGAITTVTRVDGEKRCYHLIATSPTSRTGCQTLHCENGGFCDGHVDPAKCYCPVGFSGPTCNTDESSVLSGLDNQLVGNGGVPSEVFCSINQPCVIPHHSLDSSLTLTTGYVSPGLTINTTLPGSVDGAITVGSSSPGKKTVCIQAVQGSSHIKDEVCTTVTFAANGPVTTDKSRPYFLPPTPPKDTVILCNGDTTCHIDVHYSKGIQFSANQTCPIVSQTGSPPLDGIYIFPGKEEAVDCSCDISYITPSVHTDTKTRLCVDVSLPGKRGEERCFVVQIVPSVINKVRRPCAGMTCHNMAVCVADLTVQPTVGQCICRGGFDGVDCSRGLSTTSNLPGYSNTAGTLGYPTSITTPYFDPNGVMPSNIACVEQQTCVIQVPFRGDVNKPPIPGFFSPALSIVDTSVLTTSVNGSHVAVYTIKNNQTGAHTACIQTTVDGAKNGTNLDEVCFKVTVSAGSQTPSSPGSSFEAGSYTNDSILTCPTDTVCHVSVVTKGSTNCAGIQECGVGLPGLHIFDTHRQGTSCVTDVAIRTGHSTSTQNLCVASGDSGEQRHLQISITDKQEYGPCQQLHCRNGGFCNGGGATPICECTSGYSGLECEIGLSTTSSLPSFSSNGGTLSLSTSHTSSGITTLNSRPSIAASSTTSDSPTWNTARGSLTANSVPTIPTSNAAPNIANSNAAHGSLISNTAPSISTSNGIQTSNSVPTSSISNTAPGIAPMNVAQGFPTSNSLQVIPTSNAVQGISTSNAVQGISTSNVVQGISSSDATPGITTMNAAQGILTTNPPPGIALSNTAQDIPTSNKVQVIPTSNAVPVMKTSHAAQGILTSNAAPAIPTSIAVQGVTTMNAASSILISHSVPNIPTSKVGSGIPTSIVASGSPKSNANLSTSKTSPVNSSPITNSDITMTATAGIPSSDAATTSVTTTGITTSDSTNGSCSTDTDCLNQGTCNGGKCVCKPGYNNTHCETDICQGEEAVSEMQRAKKVVKEGRVSCFCVMKGPDNVQRKYQIIKRRPKLSMIEILKHAGYGAGGSTGVIVFCFVVYLVVRKSDKKRKRNSVNTANNTPQWYME